VVEVTFRVPGLGELAATSFWHDQAATLQMVTLIAAVIVIVINAAVALLRLRA